jgi:hypothetical protein
MPNLVFTFFLQWWGTAGKWVNLCMTVFEMFSVTAKKALLNFICNPTFFCLQYVLKAKEP